LIKDFFIHAVPRIVTQKSVPGFPWLLAKAESSYATKITEAKKDFIDEKFGSPVSDLPRIHPKPYSNSPTPRYHHSFLIVIIRVG